MKVDILLKHAHCSNFLAIISACIPTSERLTTGNTFENVSELPFPGQRSKNPERFLSKKIYHLPIISRKLITDSWNRLPTFLVPLDYPGIIENYRE